ncbi:ATP-grasp domain-containing protein [Streptomyces misionensis]|uniref:ATP-grasp domain-containing protein n=1 Tax=Streptomyces misionensis TaxID=67331 RepID=A0A1H5FK42_9ACTN|nr:ATP-grasp domain-containing protein [Streptomyces misionensis]SEE03775.1 ATP-grasp domain-containing protein [Streptomyces misionensis]
MVRDVGGGGDRVLLLGAKPDESVAALGERGARITCVATPRHAASLSGRGLVERIVVVEDPMDAEQVLLGLARDAIALGEFDVVTSALEHGLVAAALIGASCAARALPLSAAVLLRDKQAQKAALRRAGVPLARSAVFVQPGELAQAVAEVGGLPVVVKPPSGAGAQDTRALRRAADVTRWQREHGAGPWLCEEFVPGDELHIDGAVRDGRVAEICVSRYFRNQITALDGALNGSVALRAAAEEARYTRARHLVRQTADALGFADGVYHLEAFEQADGTLVFGECGGRIAGGRIDRTVLLTTGVDLHRHWAAAVLGAAPPARTDGPLDGALFGWVTLSAPPGRVLSMPSVEDIRARSGVVDAELKLAVGSVMTSPRTTTTRAGRAVVRGTSVADVESTAADVAAWFTAAARSAAAS